MALTLKQASAGTAMLHAQNLHVYGYLRKRIPERSLCGLHLPGRKAGMSHFSDVNVDARSHARSHAIITSEARPSPCLDIEGVQAEDRHSGEPLPQIDYVTGRGVLHRRG